MRARRLSSAEGDGRRTLRPLTGEEFVLLGTVRVGEEAASILEVAVIAKDRGLGDIFVEG